MKEYEREIQNPKSKISNSKIRRIYHIDAYRINEEDLLNLGWEEIINDKNNVVIVEWPDRVRKILPQTAMEIGFEWLDENQRKIMFT
jgi:tRNA threonylcarbamoyladenosine biosynthesis protein TsaE